VLADLGKESAEQATYKSGNSYQIEHYLRRTESEQSYSGKHLLEHDPLVNCIRQLLLVSILEYFSFIKFLFLSKNFN